MSDLPITRYGARVAAGWMMDHFGPAISAAVENKPYRRRHICAIACQETAYKWLSWIGHYEPATIIERCVFDASGDAPDTHRTAFPRNTAAFRARYGDALTDMLIEEANLTRRLQNWSDRPWVYKGYGIFQYDLQSIGDDPDFFKNRMWYDFGACLNRCTQELDSKLASHGGDLWAAVKAYNGSGPAAENYMQNVKIFAEECGTVTGD